MLLIDHQLLPAWPRAFLVAALTLWLGGAFLHAGRLQRRSALVSFETGHFVLQRRVLFFKIAHPLTKIGNLANQLFDQLTKVLVREVFGNGRQHKKYESHPASNVNREKILIRPDFSPNYQVLKRQTGPAKFQSQMMLRPSEEDDVRLDPESLVRYDEEIVCRESNGHTILTIGGRRMVSVTGWWDPAFGSPEKGDSSVVAAVFVDDDGGYWLHDLRYLVHDPARRDDVDEATQLCRQVVDFTRELHLPSITIETNGLGRFLPAVLQREMNAQVYACSVLEHVSRRNKDQRILDAFDPVLAAGALKAHARIWQTPFIDEMRDWRPGRNGRDDGLDAVSACILAEPVRLRRPPRVERRSWRHQAASRALEIDFIP